MYDYTKFEHEFLCDYAVKSDESKGRERPMLPCNIRTEFQRDRDRILHCKSFRRLKHKTQVFLAPFGDHYRTRMTHTLEVSQIARTIARSLRLNEDLVEAISLGHDLGHTPFGHAGERVLNDIMGGFDHSEQSLRIVKYLENGTGLNLTYEVMDGIANHRTSGSPSTLEGKVVQISDKIAYINHDVDDAIRAKLFSVEDLPKDCVEILGRKHGDRIDMMVRDVIENSYNNPDIKMSDSVRTATYKLRSYLFKEVYDQEVDSKKEEKKASWIIGELFNYYIKNIDELSPEYVDRIDRWGEKVVVCDFVSGMTDTYAIEKFTELFVPSVWK